jgi:predicted MFS family arabinose efflux permease
MLPRARRRAADLSEGYGETMSAVDLGQYREVFRHRAFGIFWGGFSVSLIGDAMTRVALTWFVYETTGSSVAVGLLTFFYTAPVIVGGLIAGWLLDRFDRRTVMIVDSVIKAMTVGAVPVLHGMGVLELWHVYVVAGIYGFLMMVPLAGTPAMLPSLVPPRSLSTANALETMSYTLSGVVGPPMAGLLIAWIDAPSVLVIDAVSYLVFALLLCRVTLRRDEEPAPEDIAPRQGLGGAFRLLRHNPILLSTTLMFMAANLGLGALFVWLPIFADRVLGGGPELYGTLLGFIAAGEVVSALAVGAITLPFALGALIVTTQALAGLSVLLLLGKSTVLAGLGLVAFGLFSAPMTIWAQTLRMKIIPAAQRGRTFALLRMMMQSTNPLGGIAAGFALPAIGMTAIIAASALVITVPALLGGRVNALWEAR